MPDDILEIQDLTMEFPGVVALENVDFKLLKGEVHGLIGENGAGKSTLIKILSGVYQPTRGKILLDGQEVSFQNPIDSIKKGISTIFQELNLIPTLSIAENIFLNKLPLNNLKIVKWKELYNKSSELLSEVGLDVDPKIKVSSLKVAHQQLIEIAKAISMNSRILIMDEPTSALSGEEINKLFEIIKKLKQKDVSIIFISHKLQEVSQITDNITVLRDGRKTGSVLTREAKQDVLIKWMVGREVSNLFPKSEVKIGEIVLEVKNLTSLANGFKDVSFFLKKGEILGLFGLIGAKRTELVRALFGADRTDSGEIYLDGKLIKNSNTESMSNKGMGMVPEDRKYSGIFPILSVGQNISIASLNQFSKLSFINRLKERKSIRYIIDKLNIKTPSIERQILYLSGGNQQKVIISRWLIKDDIKVLIMDEPTRGIDVGAKSEVHKIISDLAGKGIGIIMVSSELPEILGMSDRIAVMRDGRIAGIFTRQGATQEDLLKAAILI